MGRKDIYAGPPAPEPRPRGGAAPELQYALEAVAQDAPGEWFVIRSYGKSSTAKDTASRLRTGVLPRTGIRPPGVWEFRHGQLTVGPDAGRWGLWARVHPDGCPCGEDACPATSA